ncbi:MAG: 3-dehydroquinate synthase [Bacteroidia bacterium]|nr:3-dehydroquinate synthase [Bacteroidia bacterium]
MKIHSLDYPIYIGTDVFDNLSSFIKEQNYSKLFALVDENTLTNCVPIIHEATDILVGCDIIEIPSGEQNKNIETCSTIWEELTKYGADRHSALLNIGGGVICDIGGFAAATFKRGMDFINIPTTLLAQVDASIGGKLGIDLQVIKNQIGLFSNPSGIFISTNFLKSLNNRQVLSGFAEIIKHGLISDEDYWDDIQDTDILKSKNLEPLISESIKIKKQIILADPYEKKGVKKSSEFRAHYWPCH